MVATTNLGKLREIREFLCTARLDLEVVGLNELRAIEPPEETGGSFRANARLKAAYYSELLGRICLAEDSGLCVDALDSAPGLFSARFLGEELSQKAKNLAILERMRTQKNRKAQFVSEVVVREPGGREIWASGVTEGLITLEPKGHDGFGYDPIFFVPKLQRTFAELSCQEKRECGHRGRALRNLLPKLESWLPKGRHGFEAK